MELDLQQIRARLDRMADRIMLRLKDRTYFPQNPAVYERGAIKIKGRADASFLEFAAEELEKYHAKLGRFNYKDQVPLFLTQNEAQVERVQVDEPIEDIRINLKDNILNFYIDLVKEICQKGSDPTTYGETVFCDADLISLLNERIQFGRFVAESKNVSDPEIKKIVHDRKALEQKLVRKDREAEVIEKGKQMAKKYGLKEETGARIFRWIIDTTLDLEIEYLQNRFGK